MVGVRSLERPPAYEPKHALPEEPRRDRTALVLVLVLLITSAVVAGTTAAFNASTSNSNNQFAMAALDPPTNPALTMSGNKATFSWFTVSGLNNDGAGYRISWKDAGAPTATGGAATCDATADSLYEGGTPSLGDFVADTMTPPFSDSGVDAKAQGGGGVDRPGRYICYRVQTLYPPNPQPGETPWVSQGLVVDAAVQTGFVASTVQIVQAGSLFTLDAGDKIIVKFNQPVDTSTGPTSTRTVCAGWNDSSKNEAILIGAPGTGLTNCDPDNETAVVGRLTDPNPPTPPGYRIGTKARYNTTWDWSDCTTATQCATLTATLGLSTSIYQTGVGSSNPWLFTPAGTLMTPAYDATNPARAVCTANVTGGLCVPETTGNF